MKKVFMLFLLTLPSLACFAGSMTPPVMITPTIRSTNSPIIYSPSPTDTQESKCLVTALEALNLRKTPGTDSVVIATLKHGDQLTTLPGPAQGVWIRVRASGIEGWVNSNYCKRNNQ